MDSAPKSLRIVPFHPLLFAAFPLLALYAGNVDKFPIIQLGRPLGMAVGGVLIAWAIFALVSRHLRKGALAATAVAVIFFSVGHLRNLAPGGAKALVAPACVVITVVALVALFRSRRAFVDFTRVLNLASVVLVAPSVWTITTSFWKMSETGSPAHAAMMSHFQVERYLEHEPAGTDLEGSKPSEVRPDIYYIILDAYGRDDRLRSVFGYDNTPFLKELEKRGFFVARSAGANYDQTTLCLSSALNMNYLVVPEDLRDAREEIRAPLPLRTMIDRNRVAAYLKEQGYRFVSVWSGLEEVRLESPDARLNDEGGETSFEDETRGLSALEATAGSQRERYDRHRQKVLGGFSSLESAAAQPAPKFVFAHILAPHPPFVLGEHGESLYPEGPMGLADASWLLKGMSRDEYRDRYVAQLKFVNRRILRTIDSILARSKTRPVIILQGDHGSRMGLDWESQDRSNLPEVFSILNAYHVPDSVKDGLYASITPVNTFRVLLSELFGAKLPKLEDRSFFSTASRPFDFSEITGLRPSAR